MVQRLLKFFLLTAIVLPCFLFFGCAGADLVPPLTDEWVRVWGGDGCDVANGIALDSSGNVFVTGSFTGITDFDPGPGTDERTAKAMDIFLSKFNQVGEYLWVHVWGGMDDQWGDIGHDVAVDASGDVYFTGNFFGTVGLDPGMGGVEFTSRGNSDVFLCKVNNDGDYQWACAWGGSGRDMGYGVSVDNAGNIYVAGSFEDTVDFDPGELAEEYSSNGYDDVFLSKFDSDGGFQWSRTWGGPNGDLPLDIVVDFSGNSIVTGGFSGTVDFDPGAGIDENSSPSSTVFLTKFTPEGDYLWARTWGGESSDGPKGAAVDLSGNVYVAGVFSLTVDFDPGPGIDGRLSNGRQDIFLSKFSPDGDYLWALTWGGENHDVVAGVALDQYGDIFTVGWYSGIIDLDPGPGNLESRSEGSVVISCFNPEGEFKEAAAKDLGIFLDCAGIVMDVSGDVFVTGQFDNYGGNRLGATTPPPTDLDAFLFKFTP